MEKGLLINKVRSAGKAIIRKLALPRWRPELEILIVSPGGVATTALITHVSQFVNVNDVHDRDGLKHLPGPSREILHSEGLRVLLITGEPETVYASIRRRGWVGQQAAKLACFTGAVAPETTARRAFIRAATQQRVRWERAGLAHFMQLNFNEIWDRKQDIAQFLRIADPRFLNEFPKRRPRASVFEGRA